MAEGPDPSSPNPTAPPLKEIGLGHALQRQLSIVDFELAKTESPSSTVELTVSAKGLLNLDSFSKSDPVCVLYHKDKSTNCKWIELSRTECIKNNLNPCWSKKMVCLYKFEERQMLKFMIYDYDGKSQNLSQHDYLGKMECSLAEIVSSVHGKFTRSLQLPDEICKPVDKNASIVTIVAEELGDCKKVLSLKVNCKTATKGSVFCSNNSPSLVISKQLDDGSWVLLHRTDRFDRPFNLRVSSLTSGGNLERPLEWKLFHKKENTKWSGAKLVGEFKTNYLHIIEQYQNRRPFTLQNHSKRRKSIDASAVPTGSIEILSLNVENQATFFDHIKNGLKLSITFAIDFTASNGDPARHTSLHYRHGGDRDNPYVTAIRTIGEIINDYSSDKKFLALGFGAKGYPAGNRVSHKFPINFKQTNPFCDGIEGVITSYYRVLKRVKLFGPTNFATIIQEQARIAESSTGNVYHVLLILTDGIICDPISTRDNIVKAANLPISIIIIGIGNEDFKEMEKLDCDGSFLKASNGQLASRDICQFVELKKFMDFKSIKPIDAVTKTALSQAVLAELPSQVCEWMQLFAK